MVEELREEGPFEMEDDVAYIPRSLFDAQPEDWKDTTEGKERIKMGNDDGTEYFWFDVVFTKESIDPETGLHHRFDEA